MRLAVGATRWQLIRHLLTESVLLSVAGGVVGCVLAWWIIRSLSAIELPIAVDFSLDYRVLAFALGLSLVTGVIFGLAPALKATRVDLVTTLRDDGQTRSAEHRWLTLKNALVVFQVAVSAVLLAGTSVFLQMIVAARAQRAGFAVDGVAMLETDARYAGYSGVRAANAVRRAAPQGRRDSRRAIGHADPWTADGRDRHAARRRGRRGGSEPRPSAAAESGQDQASSRRCGFRSCSAGRSTSGIARARRSRRSSARRWRGSTSAASTPWAAAFGSIRIRTGSRSSALRATPAQPTWGTICSIPCRSWSTGRPRSQA